MKQQQKIGIIGCGVSGLSVASVLLDKGHEVTLFSKHHPFKTDPNPAFASLFPAASIIPHSVFGSEIDILFEKSLHVFERLHQQAFPGLSISQHYEVFGYPKDLPWYQKQMSKFVPFDDFSEQFYPKHPDISITSGWKFQCYFADWELYYPALFNTVLKKGATLHLQSLDASDLSSLPFDILINCGGLQGSVLFNDNKELIYKGHLLFIPDAPKLTSKEGFPISYNFSPGHEHYCTKQGVTQDLYCYSRNDGWILGGSRLAGHFDSDHHWNGDQIHNDSFTQNGIEIPTQILKLNKEIIQHSFGINYESHPAGTAKMGYRFVRSIEEGLRLESEEIAGKRIIHNYGHGGAGVTLSWGCALKVAELVRE